MSKASKFLGDAGKDKRQANDFYPTPPPATRALVFSEIFPTNIWEPCCGQGHIANVLKQYHYNVYATDKFDYGFGVPHQDIFDHNDTPAGYHTIVTNPPYGCLADYLKHVLSFPSLHKMALLLRTTHLAGITRSAILQRSPLARLYQFRERITFAGQNMIDYAWYIFDRSHTGPPTFHWISQLDQTPLLIRRSDIAWHIQMQKYGYTMDKAGNYTTKALGQPVFIPRASVPHFVTQNHYPLARNARVQ